MNSIVKPIIKSTIQATMNMKSIHERDMEEWTEFLKFIIRQLQVEKERVLVAEIKSQEAETRAQEAEIRAQKEETRAQEEKIGAF